MRFDMYFFVVIFVILWVSKTNSNMWCQSRPNVTKNWKMFFMTQTKNNLKSNSNRIKLDEPKSNKTKPNQTKTKNQNQIKH